VMLACMALPKPKVMFASRCHKRDWVRKFKLSPRLSRQPRIPVKIWIPSMFVLLLILFYFILNDSCLNKFLTCLVVFLFDNQMWCLRGSIGIVRLFVMRFILSLRQLWYGNAR
jgi:lipid-A-disaccharide synthase-like uncharacterized protein